MKTLAKCVVLVLATMLCTEITVAQNYKAAKIDATGRVTDKDGEHIGNVTKEGVITDAAGVKVAHLDGNGTAIDTRTGKKLGKAEKNGNYLPAFVKTPDKGWMISSPMNGTCLVKDENGDIKAEVHENYKAFGACAIHCLINHMNHDEVLNKSKDQAALYACPMHPDVTSDISGKCSKCGMDLVKKK